MSDKKIKELKNKIKALELELESYKNTTPLYKLVLNQTEFYNGHGQLTISELKFSEIKKLLIDLRENYDGLEDVFSIQMFVENDGSWSGTVENDKRMWLTIEKIVFDEN